MDSVLHKIHGIHISVLFIGERAPAAENMWTHIYIYILFYIYLHIAPNFAEFRFSNLFWKILKNIV